MSLICSLLPTSSANDRFSRSGPREARVAVYRLLLRLGQPLVDPYVESVADDEAEAMKRFPKELATALVYRDGKLRNTLKI